MTLLLDQGNSRWKLATPDGLAAGNVLRGDNGDLAGLRRAIARRESSSDRAVVASVASAETREALRETLRAAGLGRFIEVRSTDPLPGISAGYRDNAQLGVDRLLAMVAARARCQRAFVVVDAGTAVTIDFVDADGRHHGGFILPGHGLARDCLLARTAIPATGDVDEAGLFGRDTASAVAKGARLAIAALVERLVSAAPPDGPVALFIGGGDADALAPLMPETCVVVPELVLQGLAVVARQGLTECAS
jgi:type III pantothenate kinase